MNRFDAEEFGIGDVDVVQSLSKRILLNIKAFYYKRLFALKRVVKSILNR